MTDPDPCLTCPLPDCNENDPRCPFYRRATYRHLVRVETDLPPNQAPKLCYRITDRADIDTLDHLQAALDLATRTGLFLILLRWAAACDLAALATFAATLPRNPATPARSAPSITIRLRSSTDSDTLDHLTHNLNIKRKTHLLPILIRWAAASDQADLASFAATHHAGRRMVTRTSYTPIHSDSEPPRPYRCNYALLVDDASPTGTHRD